MQSDITALPLTYHIMGPIVELYLQRITFSVSCKFYVLHNELLQPSCNIVTDTHLLFTKIPSSKLQEFLGKLILVHLTGTATLEAKPFQHLAAMREEVLYVIFLDLHKAYDALYR